MGAFGRKKNPDIDNCRFGHSVGMRGGADNKRRYRAKDGLPLSSDIAIEADKAIEAL